MGVHIGNLKESEILTGGLVSQEDWHDFKTGTGDSTEMNDQLMVYISLKFHGEVLVGRVHLCQ